MKKFFIILSFIILAASTATAQWYNMNGINGINPIGVMKGFLANGSTVYMCYEYSGIVFSTNNGLWWETTPFHHMAVNSLARNNNRIFAGTAGNGLYYSDDGWVTATQTSITSGNVSNILVIGNTVLVARPSGVFISRDNGETWNSTSLTIPTNWLAEHNGALFAACVDNGIYKSINKGATWTHVGLAAETMQTLLSKDGFIFAGALHAGMWRSDDNGATWNSIGLFIQHQSIAANEDFIYAGGIDAGVYMSSNNGISWIPKNDNGMGSRRVNALCINEGFLFATTQGQGSYKRPVDELLVIEPVSNEIPNQYSLSQNYPNPFNPATKIKFGMPAAGFARLKVYDMLGREVSVLVNEQLKAGKYEVNWNSSAFPSGVYYYKLVSGDFTDTKKMILVK